MVLEEVGCLPKAVRSSICRVERYRGKRLTRLQIVVLCQHASCFDQKSLRFLTDKVVLWSLCSFPLWNQAKGEAHPWSLVLGSRRGIHDEADKTIVRKPYLRSLIDPHPGRRKYIDR